MWDTNGSDIGFGSCFLGTESCAKESASDTAASFFLPWHELNSSPMTSSKLLDNLKYEWLFIGNVLGLDKIIRVFSKIIILMNSSVSLHNFLVVRGSKFEGARVANHGSVIPCITSNSELRTLQLLHAKPWFIGTGHKSIF